MLTTIFSSIVDELTPLNAFLIIGASLLLGLSLIHISEPTRH